MHDETKLIYLHDLIERAEKVLCLKCGGFEEWVQLAETDRVKAGLVEKPDDEINLDEVPKQ